MQSSEDKLAGTRETGRWGAIKVAGNDRSSFLQGQLSQDMNRLQPGAALLAGWTSPKGRLLCITWLIDWQEAVWLILPAELVERVIRRLQMFILRADVQLSAPDLAVRPVPRSRLKAFPEPAKAHDINNINYCLYNDNSVALLPSGVPDMALIVNPTGDQPDTPAQTTAAWRERCIEAGIPVVWAATSEEFVPQMVNLDLLDGISFTKGCYVGQEIVARTQNLGKIKRRMYRFIASAPAVPEPGQPVYSGAEVVGQIVDAVTAGNSTQLLAVVRITNAGDELTTGQAHDIRLERAALPYEVPESL